MGDACVEPRTAHDLHGPLRLTDAGLDQEMTAVGEPLPGVVGDAAVPVQSVRSAVERDAGFVITRFGRHRGDGVGGDVGRIGDDDVDAASKVLRQSRIQIGLVNVTRTDVAASTPDGDGVDVGGVEVEVPELVFERRPDCPGSATHVDYGRRPERECLLDEEFRATSGHEDAGFDDDTESTKFCPPEDLLQRGARHASGHHLEEPITGEGLEEKCGLVLGVHASGGAERAGDGLVGVDARLYPSAHAGRNIRPLTVPRTVPQATIAHAVTSSA